MNLILGDCIEQMKQFEDGSIDMIFVDPPYNTNVKNILIRPQSKRGTTGGTYDGVGTVEWDNFSSIKDYNKFCKNWLSECKRLLSPEGTIFVCGAYHGIYQIGTIMQDLGFWILNEIIWIKINPVPNFLGVRLCVGHENIIWSSKGKDYKYKFNYHLMKSINGNKQLRAEWDDIEQTPKNELLFLNNKRLHPTQKPEKLLERIILMSTDEGDTVLDPFMGTGTTGVVCKRLKRNFIGIEQNEDYFNGASLRIAQTTESLF